MEEEGTRSHFNQNTSNLDCGLNLNQIWSPLLDWISHPIIHHMLTPHLPLPTHLRPPFLFLHYNTHSMHTTLNSIFLTTPISYYTHKPNQPSARMRRRVTVVCTVRLSVCHATLYQAIWYVYTLKVRYHCILHELLKSFDSWISLKVFS